MDRISKRDKYLLGLSLVFFLIINGQYYWEGKVGILLIPVVLIMLILYLIVFGSFIYCLFNANLKSKLSTFIILFSGFVLFSSFIKPRGLYNFENLEGEILLLVQREGAANCTVTYKFKNTNKVRERSVCFGVTQKEIEYKISNDTIYFLGNFNEYKYAYVSKIKGKESLVLFKKSSDYPIIFPVLKNKLLRIQREDQIDDSRIISHEINPKNDRLKLYWKNDRGENYKNFKNLKKDLLSKGEELTFAMNGGMYLKDLSPQGYFVENGKEKKALNKVKEAFGNFYMQPNGVFYIKNNNRAYVSTKERLPSENIKYATQSGPMLVIEGVLHPKFKKGSSNLHVRNGVGVLPNGNLLFAMSKERINFYDFASYFKQKGCNNALYLDGFVSRMYLPEKSWEQLDGNFGVIIGETKLIK